MDWGAEGTPDSVDAHSASRPGWSRCGWEQSRLVAFALPNGQEALLQVDVGTVQTQGFADTHAGRCQSSEQCGVSGTAEVPRRKQLPGRGNQVVNFSIAIEVRRLTAIAMGQQPERRDFGS